MKRGVAWRDFAAAGQVPLSHIRRALIHWLAGPFFWPKTAGALKPGQTVVEATSGNTGIALAMVCAAKGYPLVVVMAESFSVERRTAMRALGAKLVLTPAAERGTGMVKKAAELAEAHGWFQALQFDNPANRECVRACVLLGRVPVCVCVSFRSVRTYLPGCLGVTVACSTFLPNGCTSQAAC